MSTDGACIGHISPEALAGGPIGKLRDGDIIEIEIDRLHLSGRIDFVVTSEKQLPAIEASAEHLSRAAHPHLQSHPDLPNDTRLWAALQRASGGVWSGCVYDTDKIVAAIDAGLAALAQDS